ncbi:hypothetical protein [Histidinibacterium lentulum]|uniref:hypothetical protein n=1 Tax=Histidinibacterium lentulum TaxID=2480588 RepID=UPI00160EC0D0|nr:hypothetical protein [Histidinibacterium lentulum]
MAERPGDIEDLGDDLSEACGTGESPGVLRVWWIMPGGVLGALLWYLAIRAVLVAIP